MWTRKSYDALYDWIDKSKRDKARKIMLTDGLDDVVARLDAAQNMGDWYRITHEAVAVVGPGVVAESAKQAEIDIDKAAAALGRKGGQAKSERKTAAVRENAKKPRGPRKTTDQKGEKK